MMRFPSIAGVRTEFVGSDLCFALIAGKRSNEATERGGGLPFRLQRKEILASTRMHQTGIRIISLVKA
jgi:hypothetical protein